MIFITFPGILYFLEHVRAPKVDPRVQRFHDLATKSGFWPGQFKPAQLLSQFWNQLLFIIPIGKFVDVFTQLSALHQKSTSTFDISGIFDGCHLNRETGSEIEKSGFGKTEIIKFEIKMNFWFFLYKTPIPYNIYGWATKWLKKEKKTYFLFVTVYYFFNMKFIWTYIDLIVQFVSYLQIVPLKLYRSKNQ